MHARLTTCHFREDSHQHFMLRHDAFLRKARDSAQQALWFLGLCYRSSGRRTTEAALQYLPFALEQVEALVHGVHLDHEAYARRRESIETHPDVRPAHGVALATSPDLEPAVLPDMDGTLADSRPGSGDLADPATHREVAEAVELFTLWESIHDLAGLKPDDSGASLGHAHEIRLLLRRFLRQSRCAIPGNPAVRFLIPETIRFLRKNLATVSVSFLLLLVFSRVEAVNSLLLNEGWRSLIPAAMLVMPSIAGRVWVWFRQLREPLEQPSWDFGGLLFRQIRFQAHEPSPVLLRWPSDSRLPFRIFVGHTVKMAGYLIWWALSLVSLRWLVGQKLVEASSLTVFLILSVFYLLLLAAYTLDFGDYMSRLAVRFLVLVSALAAAILMAMGLGHLTFAFALVTAAVAWGIAAIHRGRARKWIPTLLAIVAVLGAASLVLRWKSSREAVWTNPQASTWERIRPSEWPHGKSDGPPVVVIAASGGGSRAAVYTALLLERLHRDYPEVAHQLQAISSVSGGSLANAAYLSRVRAHNPLSVHDAEGEEFLAELPSAVSEDFLLPTLRAALFPLQDRGTAIQHTWEGDPVRLGTTSFSMLAADWRAGRHAPNPPFPLPLFNAATLDGHAVVLSPLARQVYVNQRQKEAEKLDFYSSTWARRLSDDQALEPGDMTWVYYRDAIYGLEDILPARNPTLAEAVRASANFPFGFPLIEMETVQELPFSPAYNRVGLKTVFLTDGGALSNSGMWSLFHLLMERSEVLQERGVLLLVVEASRMPTYPRWSSGAFQRARSLVTTLSDRHAIGQHLHHRLFDLLETRYGDRIAIVQLDLLPFKRYNVLTTWALSKAHRDLLEESFDARWTREAENLELAWAALTNGTTDGGIVPHAGEQRRPVFLARNRPPLD